MPRIKSLVLALSAALPLAATAQSYPTKPVRVIVGFTPGGISDVLSRVMSSHLSGAMGQQFIVDNRPGAGTTIAADLTAKAPPDGYTLYFVDMTTHAINATLYSKLPYDSVKDFTQIGMVAQTPLVMVVHPSLPVKSFKELVVLAKAQPGQINFATGGIGSSPHMSMELIRSMTGINMVPVHYKGDGAAIIDVLGGHMQLFTASIGTLLPNVKSGRMRGLAVTSLKRSAMAPEFPTLDESGLKGYEVLTWFGILAPAGTPQPVVNRLNEQILASVAAPAVRDQLLKMGFEVLSNTPQEYAAFLKAEHARWGKVVRDLNLKAE